MIHSKNIHLRTIREKDLDIFYEAFNDLNLRGEFFPHSLLSEADFMKDFHENGFWSDDFGRLLICTNDKKIVGAIWYFKTVLYYDGLEIGYIIFDKESRNKSIMTEALKLLTGYLFKTKKANRIQLAIMISNAASKRVSEI